MATQAVESANPATETVPETVPPAEAVPISKEDAPFTSEVSEAAKAMQPEQPPKLEPVEDLPALALKKQLAEREAALKRTMDAEMDTYRKNLDAKYAKQFTEAKLAEHQKHEQERLKPTFALKQAETFLTTQPIIEGLMRVTHEVGTILNKVNGERIKPKTVNPTEGTTPGELKIENEVLPALFPHDEDLMQAIYLVLGHLAGLSNLIAEESGRICGNKGEHCKTPSANHIEKVGERFAKIQVLFDLIKKRVCMQREFLAEYYSKDGSDYIAKFQNDLNSGIFTLKGYYQSLDEKSFQTGINKITSPPVAETPAQEGGKKKNK